MALSDEDVREILRLIDETPLTELRIETEGLILHVRKGGATPTEAPVQASAPSDTPPRTDGLITIPAPMLGTFYAPRTSTSPGWRRSAPTGPCASAPGRRR